MDAFRLQNVHSIVETPFIELRPLTIVVGRNSVGKSSFLRWLPLLAQSMGAPGPILWSPRGGFVDYGSFQETLRRGASEIRFAWKGRLPEGTPFEAESVLASHERVTYVKEFSVNTEEMKIFMSLGPASKVERIEVNGVSSALTPGWKWRITDLSIVPLVYVERELTPSVNDSTSYLPRLSVLLNALSDQLESILTKLVYIAPFRAEPRRSERSPEPSATLDAKGEALLPFMEGLHPYEIEDLSKWLKETLGFSLFLRREGLYSELRIDQGDGDDNIADVGFGIGQILPIAVHLWKLSRNKDAASPCPIISEQPELHLHPAHQAAVGRMFVKFATRAETHGGRLLIETHSEVLINSVGEEISKGKISPELVNVVIFDRPQRKDVRVQVATFNEKGYLTSPWPFDFFSA